MKGRSILVVEDDALNMKLVRSLLNIGGCNIYEAKDGETGIQLAHEHHPDLILMDIQLPGMDGLSATKAIKATDALKDVPIVALTSYAMEGDKEKALNAGCVGHISKPLNTRKFLETVSQFLNHDDV